jgi:hypothetical protein
LVTKHLPGSSEAWEATNGANFIVNEEIEHVIGISGSFLANETGEYIWCLGDGETSWEVTIDGWPRSLGEDNCVSVSFIEGYRYDFRAMTIASSAVVDLLVQSPTSEAPQPISDYECETAEVKGCAEGELMRDNGCMSSGPTPAPKAEPVACAAGLLNTIHSMGESENWQLSTQSSVSTTDDRIIGLSGSFLCETGGPHLFEVQSQDSMIWRFLSDDFESIDSYGSDSFVLPLNAGYRYGFRFLTVIEHEGSLAVTVRLPGGSQAPLAQLSESCERSGCVHMNTTRDESCIIVPGTPHIVPPSVDGPDGDAEDSDDSKVNVGMIVGIVIAVLVVIAIIIIVIIVWRRSQDKATIEDGEEGSEAGKPESSDSSVMEKKVDSLEPELEGEPVPEPEKEMPSIHEEMPGEPAVEPAGEPPVEGEAKPPEEGKDDVPAAPEVTPEPEPEVKPDAKEDSDPFAEIFSDSAEQPEAKPTEEAVAPVTGEEPATEKKGKKRRKTKAKKEDGDETPKKKGKKKRKKSG